MALGHGGSSWLVLNGLCSRIRTTLRLVPHHIIKARTATCSSLDDVVVMHPTRHEADPSTRLKPRRGTQ